MGSPFASHVTDTILIPFNPPHTVTLRKLSGRHLQKARDAFMAEIAAGVQARGGASAQKELMELFKGTKSEDAAAAPKADEQQAALEKAKADPLNGLDKYTLIRLGVTAWSYPESVSEQAVDDLDDDHVDFFAREVMRLTKPALFQAEDEQKADQKNDSAPLSSH